MIESYDGLCGIIPTFASSGLQIRCHYELGHGGPCSFEKHRKYFQIQSSCGRADYENWRLNQTDKDGMKRGFLDSVAYHNQKINVVVVNDNGDIEIR